MSLPETWRYIYAAKLAKSLMYTFEDVDDMADWIENTMQEGCKGFLEMTHEEFLDELEAHYGAPHPDFTPAELLAHIDRTIE